MKTDHHHFMGLALEQARRGHAEGNSPIGSVIVRDGAVIGEGHNTVTTDLDPTAHAETVAIRDACRKLGTTDLAGATCYTTAEPCPMCCWIILRSGIERLVLGARYSALEGADVGDYTVERLLALTGKTLEVVGGLRVEECVSVRDQGAG
jgi:tRNA(adenine34) deaminase